MSAGSSRPSGAPDRDPARDHGAAPSAGDGELRAEHDRLAERLAARRSIDLVRRGAYVGFAGFIASGLAVKLGFDRWLSTRATRFRGPPVFFFAALALAVVLAVACAVLVVRARRHMRAEDAQFERMRELRKRLELDP